MTDLCCWEALGANPGITTSRCVTLGITNPLCLWTGLLWTFMETGSHSVPSLCLSITLSRFTHVRGEVEVTAPWGRGFLWE